MSRSPDIVARELMQLLPSGWAWPDTIDSDMGRMLLPLADAIARFEASAEAMLSEITPGQAVQLLPDYERVLGPDPCGRDGLALSLADRQRLAQQRWIARGGQSPAYFISIAAAMGVPITITEFRATVAGGLVAGDLLIPPDGVFDWVVSLPSAVVVLFRAGASVAGDLLGAIVSSLVECLIRRDAPAHTTPYFTYEEAA